MAPGRGSDADTLRTAANYQRECFAVVRHFAGCSPLALTAAANPGSTSGTGAPRHASDQKAGVDYPTTIGAKDWSKRQRVAARAARPRA